MAYLVFNLASKNVIFQKYPEEKFSKNGKVNKLNRREE
jgi:hypothetical protein